VKRSLRPFPAKIEERSFQVLVLVIAYCIRDGVLWRPAVANVFRSNSMEQ